MTTLANMLTSPRSSFEFWHEWFVPPIVAASTKGNSPHPADLKVITQIHTCLTTLLCKPKSAQSFPRPS